jgi:hypothetical protein
MNKLLFQLVLVISSVIFFSGCTSGGSESVEEETATFFGPLPTGLPVFVDIVEPYLSTSSTNENATALFSYRSQDSATQSATKNEIFSAGSNIIVSLNTDNDDNKDTLVEENLGRSEFTLLAKSDSVYLVNHLSDEIRLLNHFTTKVCEIIPTERVADSSIDPITGEPIIDPLTGEPISERVLTVLHAELVYVMTVESSSTCISEGKKRFYELPLDHQLEISANEDAELENLELVMESQARAKLIFGWVPDGNDEDGLPQDKLEYAYLGYDSEHKKLELFDNDKEVKWSQNRVLRQFDVADLGSGMTSTESLFHLEALENYQYLVQLGLDVFVVDSGLDLINKVTGQFNQLSQIANILTDKVVTLSSETTIDSDLVYALPAETQSDDENLFIIDDAKIYHLLYQTNAPTRNPSSITRVVKQNPLNIDGKEHLFKSSFSQFDLQACDVDADDLLACLAANNIEAQTWQFFTPCEEQFGCSVPNDVNDFCETLAERIQTQSGQVLCTPTDYLHISELNDIANDATLLAYMQYAENYMRKSIFTLSNDQLFVTARMNQKDIFLAYNFKLDFSQPKLLREHVFLGKRTSLVGMDPYFHDNNLYLTALKQGAIRSNECYKNYQKVTCDLSDLKEEGSSNSCTGKDLAEDKCTNQFREYESTALFCSVSQLDDLSCSDSNLSQLNDLSIEADNEDAKWLKLYDYKNLSELMHLLTGDHDLALDNNQLDEGKLYLPSLYEFDLTGMQKGKLLGSLDGSIEQVVGGWLSKDPEDGVSEVFGLINVISEENKQSGGSRITTESVLTTYLLEQTFEDESSDIPDFNKAPKVAERIF